MAIAPPLLTARHFGSRFPDDHGGALGKHFAVVAEAHRDRLAASIAATSLTRKALECQRNLLDVDSR